MINAAKHGFQRIGYIANNTTFGTELRGLAQQYIDYATLSSYLDTQWESKESSYLFFDRALNPSDLEKTAYLMIDTGYKTPEGDAIYGGFLRDGGEGGLLNGSWQGVKIGTRDAVIEHWKDAYMGLATFTFLPNNDFSQLTYVLYKMTGTERTVEECSKLCQSSFETAQKAGEIGIYTPQKPQEAFAYFRLQCDSLQGDALYLRMDKNVHPEMQPWFGAVLMKQNELLEHIASFHCIHSGSFRFASKQAMLAFYQGLAETAMSENWTQHALGAEPYGVLRNYVEHTYSRLAEEDCIAQAAGSAQRKIDEMDGKVYFNSGLLNRLFRQIILVGNREAWTEELPVLGKRTFSQITNLRHYSETEQAITDMYDGTQFRVPGIARYFQDYRQIFFDSSLPIQLNDYHIFEDGVERGRLPKYTAEWETAKGDPAARSELLARIARDFSSALSRARLLAERNYKLAVPQYWIEDSEIQFLLPIYLGEREENGPPECALALKKITTGRAPYYRGATILTLDMAYNNSRLLAKPDVFWLEQP